MHHPATTFFTIPAVVTHVSTGAVDEYGNPSAVGASTTTTRCWYTQEYRSEIGPDLVERERWSAMFLPDIDLDANDTVLIEGTLFQVRGRPWKVTDPVTGRHTHIQATLERNV